MAADGTDKPRVIIRKKKAHHAAHHGGAWKVAYADFVTAMMALFMVLWLLTQADMKLKQEIAQYFRNPGVMPGGSMMAPDAAEARSRDPQVVARDIMIVGARAQQERSDEEERAKEQARLEEGAKAAEEAVNQLTAENPQLAALKNQVIIQVTDAGLSIQVLDKGGANRDLIFDLSSAELKPGLVQLLQRLAATLGGMPNEIQVGGHTDGRPYPPGSGMTNWELSFKRADAARRVLEANGVRGGQVIRVLAYADSQPLIADKPLADENRRLSILAERAEPAPGGPPTEGAPVVLPPDTTPHAG